VLIVVSDKQKMLTSCGVSSVKVTALYLYDDKISAAFP
jgi:hypothetical protein